MQQPETILKKDLISKCMKILYAKMFRKTVFQLYDDELYFYCNQTSPGLVRVLIALQVPQGPSGVARGPVGRSAEGESGSSCKVSAETRGKTAAEGGNGKTEKREGSGEDRCCKRRVQVSSALHLS